MYQKEKMDSIIDNDPNAEFMFYNQIMALKYYKKNNNIICINDENLINKLDNKFFTRDYYKDKVPCILHYIISGKKISIDYLTSLFKENVKYIVQFQRGAGGSGTLIYYSDTQKDQINDEDNYLVTEYYEECISMNTHLMISNDETIVLPSSLQIIERQYDHLIYKGCDFIGYDRLPEEIKSKAYKYASTIGENLRKKGYLGVCGIDFIIYNNEVYFMEINSRFQNSSTILNKALVENNQISLQEMNYNCFKNIAFKYRPITVKYSGYIEYYDEESRNLPNVSPIEVLDDPKCDLEIELLSYYKTNIYIMIV